MTQALIGQWLPANALGAESMRERATFTALPAPFALHVWWARRPLVASRGAILTSLLPAWPDLTGEDVEGQQRILAALILEFPGGEPEYHAWCVRALGILGDPVAARLAIKAASDEGGSTNGNAYGYRRAFTLNPDSATRERLHRLIALRTGSSEPAKVLDLFAGGGSIPFESARYGFETIANELNPVASAVLQGTVSLPAEFGPDLLGLIEVWGDKWMERVRKRLAAYFPIDRTDERPAYVWAHTVPCPTTGRPTPLAPDYWLARGGAGRDVAVALDVDRDAGTYGLQVVEGAGASAWGNRSTYKRGVGESIWTGETFAGDYIRKMAIDGRVGQMLLALSITRTGVKGRHFRAPTKADLEAVVAAEIAVEQQLPAWGVADLLPSEPIFEGKETKRSVDMGLTKWSDMFTPRQLLANVTALEELREVVQEARSEVGDASGRALGLYLALALDKAIDYNGMLSSWDASRLKVRNTFDRHDFAYKWTFAELDGAHSSLPWALQQLKRVYAGITELIAQVDPTDSWEPPRVHVIRGSATDMPIPDGSIDAIVTDPPYYDNVMYAECSDYFYVWLKRSLADTWPQFTDLVLTNKTDEAVANSALFRDVVAPVTRGTKRADRGPTATELADARYEELLRESFAEARRVLKDDGVLTVMFTHKRIDAWDTLGAALLDAGFTIDASWPVHTESEHALNIARKNAAASTIFLACRKRLGSEPAYWADIRRDVEEAAHNAAERFAGAGMTGVDLTIATYGPVLSVLSDRWPVYTGELGADGQPEILRPDAALDLAREKVSALKRRGLLGGRDVEFDRVTDWWLLAWSDFKAVEFPFDEARKLSIALHLEIDDLAKHHHLVKQSAGQVTLLSPAQRATAGALDADETSFETWLDRLHTLMLVYDSEGLAAARAWLGKCGLEDDSKLRDLIEASLHAIPRAKRKGDFVRPEARILDSLRTAMFDEIPIPVEYVVPAGPTQLGFDDASGEDDDGAAS